MLVDDHRDWDFSLDFFIAIIMFLCIIIIRLYDYNSFLYVQMIVRLLVQTVQWNLS